MLLVFRQQGLERFTEGKQHLFLTGVIVGSFFFVK